MVYLIIVQLEKLTQGFMLGTEDVSYMPIKKYSKIYCYKFIYNKRLNLVF